MQHPLALLHIRNIIKEVVPIHTCPITVEETLKGIRHDTHIQGTTQVIVLSIVVQEMVGTRAIMVNLNIKYVENMDIYLKLLASL